MQMCKVCGIGVEDRRQSISKVTLNGVQKEIEFCYSVCSYCKAETVDREQSQRNKIAMQELMQENV